MNARSFLSASLIAGVVIGFLGNLPVLNLVNLLLCLWVWLGAILAVYLYGRFQHGSGALTNAQSAGLGALAGLIGALIGSAVFALTNSLSAPLFESLSRSLQVEIVPPSAPGGFWGTLGVVFLFLVIDSVLYPIFGALGGLIGSALFKAQPRTA